MLNHLLNDLRAKPHRSGNCRTRSIGLPRTPVRGAPQGWAAQAADQYKSAASKPSAPKRHISAVARKRISEMMKKRWAARKKAATRCIAS